MYSCDCLRLTHTCVCNCTYMFQYWPKKASAAGSRLKAKPSEVRPHFNPLMVPNLLPSVGAVSRSNGTKRSCARLARSQPSHPRRAGAPRRPGPPAPVAVRAPQHPTRRTCFVPSCQHGPSVPVLAGWNKALLRPARSLAALPSAARRCTSTPRSSRAGRGARPATSHPPHMLVPSPTCSPAGRRRATSPRPARRPSRTRSTRPRVPS